MIEQMPVCAVCSSPPDFFWKDTRTGRVPVLACHSCMEFEDDERGMVPVSRADYRLLTDAVLASFKWTDQVKAAAHMDGNPLHVKGCD